MTYILSLLLIVSPARFYFEAYGPPMSLETCAAHAKTLIAEASGRGWYAMASCDPVVQSQ